MTAPNKREQVLQESLKKNNQMSVLSLKDMSFNALYYSNLERPCLARKVMIQIPKNLLVEFDSFIYEQVWKNFNDVDLDMMNLSEEILNQRTLNKIANLQEMSASRIINLCGYMTRNEIANYLRNIPTEMYVYLRRLFYGRNWRFLMGTIIRQMEFERIFD
ncbi:MAG: hypothetical protein ABW168_07020 [Sedimenticola sp.]